MEDQRREAAEKEAATRRATDAQVLEDAERLIEPGTSAGPSMIFSPTIGTAIKAGYWSRGCAVRLAERSMQSICGHSIVTTTRPGRREAGVGAHKQTFDPS
jgi:hypothetical protein